MQSNKYWDLVKKQEVLLKADHEKRLSTGDGLAKMCGDHRAFITSVDTPMKDINGGVVCEVTWRGAAMNTVNGTHRPSTLQEVQGYYKANAERAQQYAREEMRKQKTTTAIVMTPDQVGQRFMPQVNLPSQEPFQAPPPSAHAGKQHAEK